MCPLLLRPPVFLSGSTSARSGSGFVTSAKSETERKRVADVTGLNCRMPISALEHLDRGLIWASDSSNRSPRRRALNCRMPISALEHLDRVAFFQRHDRLLPGRPSAGVAAQAAPLGAHHHGAH